MPSQKVIITYSAPPAYLATDQWKLLHAALSSQLPLRNLHWKSASRPAIRTIQELQVDLVAVDTLRDEHTSQVPQSILERPLLNAFIVVCEDTETYRSSVKKQIKDWHTSVLQRKNQEWLIIHIVRPDSKTTGARIFQVKATVLDKIRADFNVDKRDRCVQLVWSSDYDNPTAWAELISKVKEGVLTAFDNSVTQREEEIKRSEGQRQMPGWNFCTYFILKESLASSFEGMNLHDEALFVYDELEALFHQVLRDKNLSWFGTLASPSAQDDSAPLLSVSKKPYRDLILANSISVFDFRIYLLARECLLLSGLSKFVDIAHKAVSFLNTFGRRLREIQSELPPFFIESWTYSSALSVVEQCNAWAKSSEFTKTSQIGFSAVKGELLELARHQLDILGIDVGFLPCQPPFSDALSKTRGKTDKTITPEALESISKKELKEALLDKEAFLEAYVSLTNRAIELYANAGRRKFALRMHGSLAALDVVRGRLNNALTTYTSLPAHYSPHGWTSLEAFMLTRALDLNESVEKPHDKEWLLVLLDYLKAYVQDLGKALLITKEDHVTYTSSLAQELHKAAVALESDCMQPDHPAISVTVAESDATLVEEKDGAVLQVKVKNSLPCDIPIDSVSVLLSGREGDRLTFSESLESLPPGMSTISLFCPSATVGTYSLHSSQVKIGHLTLQWLHAQSPVKSSKIKTPPVLVRIPKDLRALDVKLRQPQRVELGTSPRVIVALHTGRNEISKAMLRLSGPAGIQFQVDEATIEDDEETTFEKIDESLVLFDIAAESTVLISVPHTDASGIPSMRVSIIVDYVTTAEPHVTRTVRLPRSISAALPLAINVEDFFRGTRLFTRFTLSTTSFQSVRIKKTELLSSQSDSEDLKITKGAMQQSGVITVTQDQPGKFLFQLDAKRGKGRDSLHLHITYRMLREEVETFIEDAVDEAMTSIASPSFHKEELCDVFIRALQTDSSWVGYYCNTGELDVPSLPSKDGEFGEVLTTANEILKRGRRPEEVDKNWKEMIIPLDVPQMHILAAARLRILPNPFIAPDPSQAHRLPALYAGQPISAILTIQTSFHWAPTEDADKQAYFMRFDVEEMTKDWLVSGRKRGDFVAKDGETFETPVTLIALHHGELLLPKVAVHALPLEGQGRMRSMIVPSCETCQLHGAERILVLPRGGRTTFVVDMGNYTDGG